MFQDLQVEKEIDQLDQKAIFQSFSSLSCWENEYYSVCTREYPSIHL